MKGLAIVNPRAGLAAERALAALRNAGPPWQGMEVRTTGAAGDARAWAAEAARAGAEVVLVAGGDGTANEAGWGLMGSATALGLVPVGSGNGLARTLGIPLRPERALAVLATAVPRPMDVGLMNGRPFLNVAGVGLDAAVGADFHEWGARGGRRGIFTYVRLSFRRLISYQAGTWTVTAGEHRFEGRALIVSFVNGRQYGAAAVIAPGALLDDGLLEVVVFEDAPRLELLANAPRLFLGGIDRFRGYRRFAAAEALLTAGVAGPAHRDGEPEPPTARLEVKVQRRALHVLVPRAVLEAEGGPFLPGAPGPR